MHVVDRHRVDADPDPTFHFEADRDKDPHSTLSFTLLYVVENLEFSFYVQQCQSSRQRHSFSSLGSIHLY